jgi:hypothetical protein
MIAIVCGGRHFLDGAYLFAKMDELHAIHHFTMVVEGGQRKRIKGYPTPVGGADFWAHEWAVLRGVLVKTEYARWNDLSQPDARIMRNSRGEPYDANAGPRRNGLMIEKYAPQACVVFPGGVGSRDMRDKARAAGLLVIGVPAL